MADPVGESGRTLQQAAVGDAAAAAIGPGPSRLRDVLVERDRITVSWQVCGRDPR